MDRILWSALPCLVMMSVSLQACDPSAIDKASEPRSVPGAAPVGITLVLVATHASDGCCRIFTVNPGQADAGSSARFWRSTQRDVSSTRDSSRDHHPAVDDRAASTRRRVVTGMACSHSRSIWPTTRTPPRADPRPGTVARRSDQRINSSPVNCRETPGASQARHARERRPLRRCRYASEKYTFLTSV